MNAPQTITPDTVALTKESTDVLTLAKSFKIATAEQYQQGGERLKLIKGLMGKIALTFDPHIKRAHEAHKALVAEKNTATAPLTEAETVYKRAMIAYQQEQEQIRRQQEAKARELADKERAKLEEQARKLEAKGKPEQAEAKREAAAVIPTPVVATETPKVAGISVKESWDYEIVDANLIPREYVMPDEKKIGAIVRALKSAANIPGIRVFAVRGISSRSA